MLTILSGTNRPGSSTRKLVRYLEGVYRDLGQPISVIDLVDLPVDAFTPAAYAQKPASVQPFIDKVLTANGLIVVTPEYNGGMPGALKYFIDLLPFPQSLQNRPVCFIGLGAGEWGALRPVEQLQGVFGYRYAFIYPERVFIRHCTRVIDAEGKITDEDLVKRLRAQAEGFIKFVASLKGVTVKG
jgi:NAD(P)H-dependent FMN reductase